MAVVSTALNIRPGRPIHGICLQNEYHEWGASPANMHAYAVDPMVLIDAALSAIKFLFRNDSGCVDSISPDLILIIHNPLMPQLLKKLTDIGANLGGVGVAELSLQFSNDLAEGSLAVAAFEHLASRALELNRSFRKENHADFLCSDLTFCSPAASCRQPLPAGILGRGHASGISRRNPSQINSSSREVGNQSRFLHFARFAPLRSE